MTATTPQNIKCVECGATLGIGPRLLVGFAVGTGLFVDTVCSVECGAARLASCGIRAQQ